MVVCAGCSTPIDPSLLSCPSCHALTRSKELESLAAKAREATAVGHLAAARGLWEQAAALLPPDTMQYRSLRARIAEIDSKIGVAAPDQGGNWGKRAAAGLGPIALFLWKFKALLLGLTKISTLLSMLAWVGVYWSLYGWPFAVGSVLSIYIHEMGHVLALRRYGIAADAPFFIPGLGAFVRLRQLFMTPVQDSRVGLAGPIYGLGAAAFALAVSYVTGNKMWGAVAHFGAVINLFNLIPVWQLDGSRGFRSLTRQQRIVVLGTAVAMWYITSEVWLLLIAAAAVYRLFTKDVPEEPDNTGLMQFVGLLVALSAIAVFAQAHTPLPTR